MMKLTTKLRKSGNAQVVPVPAAALKELGVELGTEFSMTVEHGRIELVRVRQLPSREDVLAALDEADLSVPDDIRDFTDAAPVGREIL